MTIREKYDVIANVFEGIDHEAKDEIIEFCHKEIAALERKNAKARERAAEKRVKNDEIKDAIEGILTEEPMTINDILAELDDEALTPAKVVSRMTQLVKADKAAKQFVKIDGRKLTGYVKA